MCYQRIILTLLLALGISPLSFAGSSPLTVTARTTITASTCTAELHNAQDQQATTIDLGDVYLNELASKSKYQNFSLVFSNCEGLAKDQANVTLAPQSGCDGTTSTGGGYRNALTDADAAMGVSIEVWTTNQPEGSGSTQLSCKTKPTSIVDVSQALGGNTAQWPLSARIVIAADNTIADVRAGQFSTNAVFTVTYE
ncbi:fimbrial protein [[Enterobacter] lignolyticus]|uniref:Fimbrial protein n=1 Tax=[Enterobacter] lignolyticus TaxID=1334193 RepID=A0A806X282_9ENTR|nr:fimbrial protein [[Enterobacter] lignolyticus]ALR75490.1 fimbrial protein [[Enterobacter] lignolyticus]